LLEAYSLEPRKSLGQNFLHDPNVLEKVVASADVTADTTVLEIGAGTGALTEVLAAHAGRVITLELDRRMEPLLLDRLGIYDNVEIVFADVLKTDIVTLVGDEDYVVVANVPYYITSAILRHLLEAEKRPLCVVMTVQLEVAERIIAKPGAMSVLAVSVQYYTRPKIVMRLNPAVFYPRPDVTSAVIRLDTHPVPPVHVPDEASFFAVVRAGFSQKRKQLKNTLAAGLRLSNERVATLLDRAGIDPRRRAETLSLEEWAAVTRAYVDG
ncbi:MAG: ribosomal RNA small subunit methyltransferase A, partial [Anaerolineae bacterium]|nr:ribosomal RNA small subunit methyltransferase A [Anaerolineae bacterium]